MFNYCVRLVSGNGQAIDIRDNGHLPCVVVNRLRKLGMKL